jgi:dihydrolipoamide dehydrogenase
MADKKHAEVLVIGAGPGGYPAAFAAADHGKKVILVNDDVAPGGVCLNRGCIPSKALLHVAKLINEAKESAHWGVEFQPPKIEIDKVRAYKNKVVNGLTGGIKQLCKARKVELVEGRASFLDSKTVAITYKDGKTENVTFDNCIIATGSQPAIPPIFRLNDPRVMDSTGALELADIPGKLLVIGGGYIGLEMGSVYCALGTDVTVVEMTPGLLPGADADLVKPLEKLLRERFKSILLNTKVASLTATPEGIKAKLEAPEGKVIEETFDRVLISIGRRPNSQGFGLENTRVQVTDKGFIKIDNQQRTTESHIFAIGDVAGEPMLAHKATREAKVAAETILGEPAQFDAVAIPAVVFTDPEIAWCGITERQAQAENKEVIITRFPWAASGRAQSIDRTEGLTKVIFEPKTERVLGVGIVGPGAGEMIAEAVLAVEMGAVARDLSDSIHAHPTLSETLMEAGEMAFSQATHMFRPKR